MAVPCSCRVAPAPLASLPCSSRAEAGARVIATVRSAADEPTGVRDEDCTDDSSQNREASASITAARNRQRRRVRRESKRRRSRLQSRRFELDPPTTAGCSTVPPVMANVSCSSRVLRARLPGALAGARGFGYPVRISRPRRTLRSSRPEQSRGNAPFEEFLRDSLVRRRHAAAGGGPGNRSCADVSVTAW